MTALSKSTVLVTTTFSPNMQDHRAPLAIRTCLAARDHGYKIIVVDGSPCPEFKAALRETGAIVIDQTEAGMGASRRQTIKAGLATDAQVIVWLEPEKYPIVPLLEPCIIPVLTGNSDVVVPRRRNLDGYPPYQQLSEYRGNWTIGNLIGRFDLDLYIGPRVMSPQAARLMAAYDGKCGQNIYGDKWEVLFIPIIWFLKAEMQVTSVIVNYVHPPEQIIEDTLEMNAKRDEQRLCLVDAMEREVKQTDFSGFPKH